MLPRSCYDYSTTITDHRLVLSIRSDYDGTGLYDMLSVRRHTYAGACFFFFFLLLLCRFLLFLILYGSVPVHTAIGIITFHLSHPVINEPDINDSCNT